MENVKELQDFLKNEGGRLVYVSWNDEKVLSLSQDERAKIILDILKQEKLDSADTVAVPRKVLERINENMNQIYNLAHSRAWDVYMSHVPDEELDFLMKIKDLAFNHFLSQYLKKK
jgi:hypothetical protein